LVICYWWGGKSPQGGGGGTTAWMLSEPRAGLEERRGVGGGVERKMKVKTDPIVTQLY
jgi:hypothetical protein